MVWAHVKGGPFKYFRMKLLNKDSQSTGKHIRENVRFQMPSPTRKNVKGATGKRKNESSNNVEPGRERKERKIASDL